MGGIVRVFCCCCVLLIIIIFLNKKKCEPENSEAVLGREIS